MCGVGCERLSEMLHKCEIYSKINFHKIVHEKILIRCTSARIFEILIGIDQVYTIDGRPMPHCTLRTRLNSVCILSHWTGPHTQQISVHLYFVFDRSRTLPPLPLWYSTSEIWWNEFECRWPFSLVRSFAWSFRSVCGVNGKRRIPAIIRHLCALSAKQNDFYYYSLCDREHRSH